MLTRECIAILIQDSVLYTKQLIRNGISVPCSIGHLNERIMRGLLQSEIKTRGFRADTQFEIMETFRATSQFQSDGGNFYFTLLYEGLFYAPGEEL